MEDGEGGEDELMQEEAERHIFRKSENQPSSQEVQEHMKTHIVCTAKKKTCIRQSSSNALSLDSHTAAAVVAGAGSVAVGVGGVVEVL